MSRRPRAIFCEWDGEVFRPKPAFMAYLNREYVVGEVYPMAPEEERDMVSHGHYFAALHQGFLNLSEENAKRFPTETHLRHWALVQCGYCAHTQYVMANNKEARKLAADIRDGSPYTVIRVRENVVERWDAESQSKAAMKKERFQKSKWDVLDLVAGMARTTRAQLMKNAGRLA
jgi:hypothetical protein